MAALMKAWEDGKVTVAETEVLDALREELSISVDEHLEMEMRALQSINTDQSKARGLILPHQNKSVYMKPGTWVGLSAAF